jgi:asparagine synthase (glutamine-hydrolysing)
MYLDLVTYLPDDILVKVDRATMGVGLEARVPMLDHRLVEFAWRVPVSMKLRDGQGKWLLRQLLYRHVPNALVERPKTGFGLPVGDWLRGPLRDWAEALLDPAALRAQSYLDATLVRSIWNLHLSGRRNMQDQLWDVLMFQSWLEACVARAPSTAAGG